MLTQEIAILIWLTGLVSAALWYLQEERDFDTAHRQRYGTYRSRSRLLFDLLRSPASMPSIIDKDKTARMDARFHALDDVGLERQRRVMILALVTLGAIGFIGLPAISVVATVIREVLPGTLIAWAAAFDVVLMAVWLRRGVRDPVDPERPRPSVATNIAGAIACAASLAALVALWQSGGIAV